jgi:hypothetical protein
MTKKMKHIKLYENFNPTLQVYHRTSPEAANEIMQHGFRSGAGANYGQGVYFYLNAPKGEDLSGHGSSIVQGEIQDLSGFLITDPTWAKSLLGKESDLTTQIEGIMGKEWTDTHDIQPILDEPNSLLTLSRLDQGRYKREDSPEIKTSMTVVGKELKGWIRKNDDPRDTSTWLICYDPTRVTPVAVL